MTNPKLLGTEEGQQIIDIWAKAVETQMHFNEMQVKSRQLGLTFVTAALGIGIVLLSNGDDFAFSFSIVGHDLTLHVSVLLTVGAILALHAVKTLDLNVYHRMLRGAVTFGEDLEKNCLIPMLGLEKGMTSSISHFSRFSDASIKEDETKKYIYEGTVKVTAHDKIRSFYRWTQLFLASAALVLMLVTNSSSFGNASETQTPENRKAASTETESSAVQTTGMNLQEKPSNGITNVPADNSKNATSEGSN